MKKFIVEDQFWDVFPDAKIGVVICKGIDNTIRDIAKYDKLLRHGETKALEFLQNEEFSKNDVIKVWRDAYQKFKTKKGARSSIEALLKRVEKGNPIGSINPLVDIYNSISLNYALPCGGEDIESFAGNVKLTKAIGNEEFITLGTDKNSPPYEDEIVYKDEKGAICRCWNWRESVRTMLTEKTKNAFMCIELINGERLIDLENALNDLAQLVQKHLAGDCEIHIIDIENKAIQIV